MEKLEYESPRFEFQEMQLAERIAATCWGYAYAWYDANGNGKIDLTDDTNGDGIKDSGIEKIDLIKLGLGENGCQGNAAREALKRHFKETFRLDLTDDDVSTSINNDKSNILVPIS